MHGTSKYTPGTDDFSVFEWLLDINFDTSSTGHPGVFVTYAE